MDVAFYADYIAGLRSVFAELDQHPERFQTFSLHIDLLAAGNLVVYETKRAKGQTDSVYFGRPASTGTSQKMTQAAAFSAIDRFFGLGQFVALKAETEVDAPSVKDEYPHCAVNFTYRKKGEPQFRSMLMIFIGFNDDEDARGFAATGSDRLVQAGERPFSGQKLFEWR